MCVYVPVCVHSHVCDAWMHVNNICPHSYCMSDPFDSNFNLAIFFNHQIKVTTNSILEGTVEVSLVTLG